MSTVDTGSGTPNNNYVEQYLPPAIIDKLEAGAFKSLCTHLRERSDEVQNIDLMTISGFCRNCLCKWMVIEARTLADQLKQQQQERESTNTTDHNNNNNQKVEKDTTTQEEQQHQLEKLVQSLDALGYDEAAQYVYGMNYSDWKKRHAKKADDDQMTRYNNSQSLWATHDKEKLSKRSDIPAEGSRPTTTATTTKTTTTMLTHQPDSALSTKSISSESTPLTSNVCCQDVDDADDALKEQHQRQRPTSPPQTSTLVKKATRDLKPYQGPPPPSNGMIFSVGILTISDRAASGSYETGDLSGPAVQQAVMATLESLTSSSTTPNAVYKTNKVKTAIVSDDVSAIQTILQKWSNSSTVTSSSSLSSSSKEDESSSCSLDLILTTGGTGFAPRDVTPEATSAILDRSCPGLVAFCTAECSKLQPLASLSRGTAGIRGTSLIVNLPGNPKGVEELIPILLPLALHAMNDLQQQQVDTTTTTTPNNMATAAAI